jgi:tRNA(Phe) wybutosine-synthesizing methylase Tyw3
MGLYPIEQAVLERFDGGQSVDQITRATGFRRATVQNIIHRFDVNLAQDVRLEEKLRSQTARLGVLVRQAGGHR